MFFNEVFDMKFGPRGVACNLCGAIARLGRSSTQ
jgi:hypothetical protein